MSRFTRRSAQVDLNKAAPELTDPAIVAGPIQEVTVADVVAGTESLPESEVTSLITVDQVKPVEETDSAQQLIDHIRAMTTKSAQIRYLASLGWKNGPIAKFLSAIHGKTVIYQHVRNVLNQKLKTVA